MRDEPAQERQVRRHAADLGLAQRSAECVVGLRAGRPVGDQLRDHRVVGRPDLVALLDAGVDADTGRQTQPLERPGLRQERARILRVEPYLDRVPEQVAVGYKLLAARDAQLLAHEVDAGDELRHRVLDLDARVQLEEEEVAPVEHELGRARALVADRTRERDGRVAHARAELRVERRRRRLLEHLLMAALDRALALAEREYGAVRVCEQLDLDMARPLEVALEEERVVPERAGCLALRGRDRVVELLRRSHDPHAAAAAARGRLDEQRVADLVRRATSAAPARPHAVPSPWRPACRHPPARRRAAARST